MPGDSYSVKNNLFKIFYQSGEYDIASSKVFAILAKCVANLVNYYKIDRKIK